MAICQHPTVCPWPNCECPLGNRPMIQTPEPNVLKLILENERMRDFLERAMAHGLNGNRYYDAMDAGDLGDEIKQFLRDHAVTAP
jgi:hypothetical protein